MLYSHNATAPVPLPHRILATERGITLEGQGNG